MHQRKPKVGDMEVGASFAASKTYSVSGKTLVPCAWCELRVSAGLYQGTECCNECKAGGRVHRVRMAMGRWKKLRDQKGSDE